MNIKVLFGIGLPLVVFVLFGLSMWYVAYRINSLLGLRPLWLLRLFVFFIVAGAAIGMIGVSKFVAPWIGIVSVICGYIFSFYIFLLLSFFILHIIQLKFNVPLIQSGVLVLLVAFVATTIGAFKANNFAVNKVDIFIPHLNKEVIVALISDVHLGHHRGYSYLSKIVEETNRLQPDIVLIAGDLIDSNVALRPDVLSPLSDFVAPVYFVGGNHEKYVNSEMATEMFRQQGVRILQNETEISNGLQLIGLNYMNADENTFDMHPSDDKRTIKGTLAELQLDSKLPTVLFHHSPVGSQYVSEKGIDLMLSGHTHAGQVFPFTLLSAIIFPYNKGLSEVGNTQIFVSQGAGTYMPRIRLGSSNEINLLKLKPADMITK